MPLKIDRFFTKDGQTLEEVLKEVPRNHRSVKITDPSGKVIFEQNGIEAPVFWSDQAVKIVAQKYFYGKEGTAERENSVFHLVKRVVDVYGEWALKDKYFTKDDVEIFKAELGYILINQLASFNSPVWFNIGNPHTRNQVAACFLVGIDDNMESILEAAVTKGQIFKWGSGSGTNLSKIRSNKEFISGGGKPSGPLSFLKIYDTVGQTIKSGGRSRRAAMLFCLDIDHPDVEEFIHCKSREEAKGKMLIASKEAILNDELPVSEDVKDFVASVEDWDSMDGEAYQTVSFQNMNISVQIPDEFMKVVEEDGDWNLVSRVDKSVVKKVKARKLFREIAESAWKCADPGVQFSTTINKWHTVPEEGPIVTSNPCCFTGDTKVFTATYGFMEIRELASIWSKKKELPYILAWDDDLRTFTFQQPARAWCSGLSTSLVQVHFDGGFSITSTPEHKYCLIDGSWKEAKDLLVTDRLKGYSKASSQPFPLRISHIVEHEAQTRVYDLEMPLFHNFVVFPPITFGEPVGVTVHNSEYLSINETACNLASINIDKCIDHINDDSWFHQFAHVVKTVYIAMDLSIENSDYPTQKIAEGTKKVRNLGLGYTNLGSFLMRNHIPYDSDEARKIASTITAFLTGFSYLTSTYIAENLNKKFPVFDRNKDHVLKVLNQHRNYAVSLVKDSYKESVEKLWNQVVERASKHGVANSQATVIAPTGCLVPSTLVVTSDGLVKLGEVSRKFPKEKAWADIDTEIVQEFGPQKATKLFNNGYAQTIKVTTGFGYEIEGTRNHKIRVVDQDTGDYIWKELQEVEPGDSVVLRRGGLKEVKKDKEELKLRYKPKFIREDEAVILGMLAAGGKISGDKVVFSIRKTEDSREVNRFITAFSTANWKTVPYTRNTNENTYSLVIENKSAARWFSQFPELTRHRTRVEIPKLIATANPDILASFLSGITEACGVLANTNSSTKPLRISVYFKKDREILAKQYQTALLALGVVSDREAVKLNRKKFWKVTVANSASIVSFFDNVGLVTPHRKAALLKEATRIKEANKARAYLGEELFNRPIIKTILTEGVEELDVKTMSVLRTRYEEGRLPLPTLWSVASSAAALTETNVAVLAGFGERILFDRVVEVEETEGVKVTVDIEVPKNNTYVANGFIVHNTISFMMDAETTGIEPLLGLQVYKNLSGGGTIRLTSSVVEKTLRSLGYGEEVFEYLSKHGHLKGSPVKEEHLPIFDTAFGPGGTSIHYMGHLKMLAAVQPLVSGSISKTCNLPHDVTVEDVEQLYMWAWRHGLKCVAIYRDGCKFAQAITTNKTEKKTKEQPSPKQLTRRKLPQDALAIRHKFSIAGHEGVIHTGLFEDGNIAEVFIRMYKDGSTVGGLMDCLAICMSWMAQHGVLTKNLLVKLVGTKFDPMGLTQNPDIRFAQSPVDYISRYLLQQMSSAAKKVDFKVVQNQQKTDKKKNPALIGPPCTKCGAITEPKGSCFTCPNCGEQSGCG